MHACIALQSPSDLCQNSWQAGSVSPCCQMLHYRNDRKEGGCRRARECCVLTPRSLFPACSFSEARCAVLLSQGSLSLRLSGSQDPLPHPSLTFTVLNAFFHYVAKNISHRFCWMEMTQTGWKLSRTDFCTKTQDTELPMENSHLDDSSFHKNFFWEESRHELRVYVLDTPFFHVPLLYSKPQIYICPR